MQRFVEDHEKLTWTIEQAALALGVSERHFRNLLKDGKGPRVVRLGGRVFIRRQALADWLKRLEDGPIAA